jgi:cellulose synthase/poly-beta-1,6-N-acetylglucosamine synthase-like glycosyltransferase
LGGFDEKLPGEDLDFGYRVSIQGYQSVFAHDLVNYELVTTTPTEWIRQRLRWLGNDLMACIKNLGPYWKSKPQHRKTRLAGLFFFVNAIWFFALNIVGIMHLVEILYGATFNWNYFTISFVGLSVVFLLPAIFRTKKLYLVLLMPFMLFYYWIFSILITWVFIHEVILKTPITYLKARYKPTV